MGQTALDPRFEDGLRPRVPQWRAVLGQQVCELLADLPEGVKERVPVNFRAVSVNKKRINNLIWANLNKTFV